MLKVGPAGTVADTTHESEDTQSNRIDPSELNRNRVFLSFLYANNELSEQVQNRESTIEELVIYDKSSPAVGRRQAYNTRRAKFTLISDVPLPPPSNKYQSILINAETLKKITDYNKN